MGDGGKKSDWVKILLGVDRLDYIKGVPQKLLAFERLLENNPELVEHVVLVQISVPTRCEVEEYGQLRSFVEAIVGRINGRFGTVCYTPVRYLYRSVPFLELSALYRAADVCIVSSTRDGMNLVACEYIASQTNEAGVLVLSEFAGVAQSLGGAYLVVNPWDQDALAAAMYEAIHMDYESRKNAMQTLSQYVSRHTASYWGRSFIDELTQCRAVGEKKISQYARPLALEEVKSAFKPNSILMIDWDAVVGDYLGGEWRETRPIVNLSSTADFYQSDFLKYDGECHELGPTISDYDDERRIKLAESINRIARSATVWIMTRMPFSCVNQLFTANVSLICEHGCSIRFGTPYFPAKICNEHRKKGIIPKKISDIMGVTTLFDDHGKKLDDHLEAMEKSENVVLARLPGIVRQKLVPIMRYYAQHTPGADFVVATEEILSVSFVGCDSEFADWQARELVSEIDRVLESIGKVVRRGKIANNGLEQSVITEIKTSRNISEVNNNTMLTSESREVLEKYTDYSDQLGFDVKNDKKALKLNTMARIMAEGDFRNVDVIPASGVGKAELLQKIIDTTDGEQFVLVLCDPRTELSAKCKHVDRVNFRFATISNPVSDAPYHVKNVADLLDLLAT